MNGPVHRFAMTHLTSMYINSYWATEHGGMVWSRCHGNEDQPVQPDARTWPLPWIDGDVLIRLSETGEEVSSSDGSWRRADDGESGEVAIRQQYPYLALTVWKSAGFGSSAWRGDLQRWRGYFSGGIYVQGDTAVRDASGGFTFHGRSDEVINVGGNRIGTAEIESALIADSNENADSPVVNCAVVGLPDEVLGSSPCAFIVSKPPRVSLTPEEEGRLRARVKRHVGVVPSRFVVVPALPETYSGKYMRALLRALAIDAPTPNLGSLRNPDCVEPLRHAIAGTLLHETAASSTMQRQSQQPVPDLQRQPQDSFSSLSSSKSDDWEMVGSRSDSEADTDFSPIVLDLARTLSGNPAIELDTPLMSGGIDSLLSIDFISSLSARTTQTLSPTLIFEHATPRAIAYHLSEQQQQQQQQQQGRLQPQLRQQCSSQHLSTVMLASEGRFPGRVASAAQLLLLANAAVDAVGDAPPQRWPGTTSTGLPPAARALASASAVELFDNVCFGISHAESSAMDPQQRLLLEIAKNAFVHAGMLRHKLSASDTAVQLAISNTDWGSLQFVATHRILSHAYGSPAGNSSVYAATGGAISVAAGRISYVFDLHGPCESLDTACSSSLAAIHLSLLHLLGFESRHALAAAASLVLVPHISLTYARAGMLSEDGRCKTFDARANGYARGEGVGAVVVASAQKGAGHSTAANAMAMLTGSAIRQDGVSASLTAPNGSAQAGLLLLALTHAENVGGPQKGGCRRAGIESHGTGTPLGDPTELRALTQALFTDCAHDGSPVAVGGIKASTGHLEPSAGMIGLMKLVGALNLRAFASNAQLRVLNPHLEASVGECLRLPSCIAAERGDDQSLTGGVSSFGYSGTIAHLIIEVRADGARQDSLPSTMVIFRRLAFGIHPMGSHWHDPDERVTAATSATSMRLPIPFLGLCSSCSDSVQVWEQQLSDFELAFLQNHRVGYVPLLPGTCYIEICRSVAIEFDEHIAAFDLTSVAFSSILFLDESSSAPIIRAALTMSGSTAGQISITSHTGADGGGSWDTHSTMMLKKRSETKEELDCQAFQAQSAEHVTASQFYATCGNDYQGEFRAMESAWSQANGSQVLSKVAYDHTETSHVHLRSCAWLDACLHAPYWFVPHRNRPFYISSVRSYSIRSMDCTRNKVMWSMMDGQGGDGHALQPETLKYHSDEGNGKHPRCRVQIDGSRLGFFEIGWLEQRRITRHIYLVDWQEVGMSKAAAFESSRVEMSVVAIDATSLRRTAPFNPTLHAPLVILSTKTTSLLTMLEVISAVLQAAASAPNAVPLLLLTSGNAAPSMAARSSGHSFTYSLWGLARSARQELGEHLVQGLQLSNNLSNTMPPSLGMAHFHSEPELIQLLTSRGDSEWRCSRLSRMAPLQQGPIQLNLSKRGAISNLQPRQLKTSSEVLGSWQAEMSILAVGLNFRDVLNVLGEYPGDPGMPGLDCCGSISNVRDATHLETDHCAFGFAFGSLASSARTDARLLVQKPSVITSAQATSLPITWSTVHVAYLNVQLCRRQRALLHTTAGGVGLVALDYAWLYSAEAIASAGSMAKHRVVREQVRPGCRPLISASSRSGVAFAAGASYNLCAHRLHAVLNSLSADLTTVSFALLGQLSTFVEIGKRR